MLLVEWRSTACYAGTQEAVFAVAAGRRTTGGVSSKLRMRSTPMACTPGLCRTRKARLCRVQGGTRRTRETSELPSYSFPFSLHQLVLLKAYAAADGDFERVAATQGLSRGSVSQALRKLEKELGTELLEPQARPSGA